MELAQKCSDESVLKAFEDTKREVNEIRERVLLANLVQKGGVSEDGIRAVSELYDTLEKKFLSVTLS